MKGIDHPTILRSSVSGIREGTKEMERKGAGCIKVFLASQDENWLASNCRLFTDKTVVYPEIDLRR
jgi:hypothetical protein